MELSPDLNPRERREAIETFLSSLSSWDLITLRNKLRAEESRIRLASLDDLPPEIVIYIAQYLELQDLLTCAQVNRNWRAAWTLGPVTASLCCKYFPGLTESQSVPHSEGHHLFARASARYIDKYLRRTTNAYTMLRWYTGDAESMGWDDIREDAFHQYEYLSFGEDPIATCYQDGKLAWQPENSYVVVTDISAKRRKRCTFGGSLVAGRRLDLQAISSDLVILSSVDAGGNRLSCRELQVWHMESGEWRRISLPGRFVKCYAQGTRAVFLTVNGQVFVWSWGGQMAEMDVNVELASRPAGCAPCFSRIPGVLFHPTEDNVVFLAWIYKPESTDDGIHAVVVVKYQDGKPVQRHQTAVENPALHADPERPYIDGIMRFTLRCQRMNSHGLCMVGVVHIGQHFNGGKVPVAGSEWRLVCFNVLTESFEHRRYEKCLTSPKFHRPTWDWADWHDIHAWDDYMTVLWQPRPHVISEPCTFTELFQATDSLSSISGSAAAFRDSVRPRKLEPAATIDAYYQKTRGISNHVFMDDRFVVLAGPDACMVSEFQEGKATGPGPLETGMPAGSRVVEPPRPARMWEADEHTTLEAPRLG